MRLKRPPRSEAWSQKKGQRDRKRQRREVKVKRRAAGKGQEDNQGSQLDSKELEDLEEDFRLVKKLKRKQVGDEGAKLPCHLHRILFYSASCLLKVCARLFTTNGLFRYKISFEFYRCHKKILMLSSI